MTLDAAALAKALDLAPAPAVRTMMCQKELAAYAADAAGDLVVELRFVGGRTVSVPGLRLVDGRGSLGATVDLRLRDLRGVRVTDADGKDRYTVERPR
jgi:hypothetical protein